MTKTYRQGAVGALMDEYERAAREFQGIIERLGDDEYAVVHDPNTDDEDCHSIRTICSHVVHSGYGYASRIRTAFGDPTEPPEKRQLTRAEALSGIDDVLAFTVETLDGRWTMPGDEMKALKMVMNTGVTNNLEQLLQHAICHVLRHRRQVDRFLEGAARA